MKNIKANARIIFEKYKHAWVFLYGLIYMPWFCYLEKTVTTNYYVIHSVFDDYIPFCEIFVVPYLLWFPYMAAVAIYFFKYDKQGFYRAAAYICSGMTIFLVISTILPNGLALRPMSFPRENLFTELVKIVYMADTPTNVLPSLHVYNSVAAYAALSTSQAFRGHRHLSRGCLVLSISIVLSTMFIKQHSVVDVVAGLIMAYLMYQFVYEPETRKVPGLARQTI